MSDNTNQTTLVIDLDGTLIKTDILIETTINLLKKNPFYVFYIFFWLIQGKANLKNQIAQRVDINASLLPYRACLIEKIKEHPGKKILATATHYKYATEIANYLGIFDEVLASDQNCNLKSLKKAEILKSKFGNNFDYIGDSSSDIPVWKEAQKAYIVNPNKALKKTLVNLPSFEFIEDQPESSFKSFVKLIRVHQWSKNLLLFLPLIGAHEIFNFNLSLKTFIGFISFSLCASSVYLLNDILDLESDRAHRTKKNRPLANANLSIVSALIAIPILILVSAILALNLNIEFLTCLIIYYLMTFFYTIILKKIVILDLIMLTTLYTIRIISGAVINNLKITFWFLAFAVFLLFSLAVIKRFVEINESEHTAKERGYHASDLNLISISGITSSQISILIIALYLYNHSDAVLDRHPIILLILCLTLLYGYTRLWLLAFRKQINDDPVVFILKDYISLILGLISVVILFYLT